MKRNSGVSNNTTRHVSGKAKAAKAKGAGQKKRGSSESVGKQHSSPRIDEVHCHGSEEIENKEPMAITGAALKIRTVSDSDVKSVGRPPASLSATDVADPKLVHLLSPRSREILENASILNSWMVPPANYVWLLLRVAAGARQGVLSEEQCERLRQQIEDCTAEGAQELLHELGVRLDPWECQICFSDQEPEQGWRCPTGHRFCSTCMQHHVDAVAFPRCPAEKCDYLLCETDFRELEVSTDRLNAFLSAQLQRAIDEMRGPTSTGRDCPEAEVPGFVKTKAEHHAGASSLQGGDTVLRCSNRSCGNLMLLDSGAKKFKFACPCGANPFCSVCREEPYHFHGDCNRLQEIREFWLKWLEEERYRYLGIRRQADNYGKALQALRDTMARADELEQDEKWKEVNCRYCPKCQRPINKTEGCDSMRCGQDTHGGNEQPGCGHAFKWSQARPYKSMLPQRAPPKLQAEKIECRGRDTLHVFINCDICGSGGEGIRGPRFRCLHCPCYNVCLTCEPELAISHTAGHVFEVLFETDFEWSSLGLPLDTAVRTVRHGDVLPWGMDPAGIAKVLPEGLTGELLAVAEPSVEERHRLRRRRGVEVYRVLLRDRDLTLDSSAYGFEVEVPAVHLEPMVSSTSKAEELIKQAIALAECREIELQRKERMEIELKRQEILKKRLGVRMEDHCSSRLQAWREILYFDDEISRRAQ